MSHDIFTEPYVHEGGDQQVSIGWFREDGDFQIVCTLRSLYFLTPSYQLGFEFAVTMLKTMLEYTITARMWWKLTQTKATSLGWNRICTRTINQ